MTKKKKIPGKAPGRELTLSLEAFSGGVSLFYADINGIPVIQAGAEEAREWTGTIPETKVTINIRVVGIAKASFKLSIDLPGEADDQSLTFQLKGGYYETSISL